MASDYFLKIDGIKGESKDAGNVGAIEISSFSWGVSQSSVSSGAGGGAGAGKASVQPMRFVAPTTTASAALFQACASGQHLATALLTARTPNQDGTSSIRATYALTDCTVMEYFVGGPADDVGTGDIDTFSLSFRKVTMNLTNAAGAVGRGGWDLATNKKV